MDGNDNVIEKDFASAFDHERRGGFLGHISRKKEGASVGEKAPTIQKKRPRELG